MEAGKHIGAGICLVQVTNKIAAEIVLKPDLGSKLNTVVPQGADNEKNGHAADHENAHPVKFLSGVKKFIDKNSGNKQKPRKIRDDKVFAEGDLIVEGNMQNMVIGGDCFFKPEKPWNIDQGVGKNPDMTVFFKKIPGLHVNDPLRFRNKPIIREEKRFVNPKKEFALSFWGV